MPPRLGPLLPAPIGFAHRGARAHAPENTLEAFRLARKLGATGLETDLWVTADGEVVLDHDGEVGRWGRRKPIREVHRDDLPDHIPTLGAFYDEVGTLVPVSVDMKDPAAFEPMLEVVRRAGPTAEPNLWICHPDLDLLTEWREHTSAKLVNSTRLAKIKEGPERRAFELREREIDAVNMRITDWTGGLVTMFHRYERLALGWDAQHTREIAQLIDAGIDGVFSDHVDRLVETIARFFPTFDSSSSADGADDH